MSLTTQEVFAYALVVAALLAACWAVFGGRGGANSEKARAAGWERLPPVFKSLWGVATAFEESFGTLFAEWLPARRRRYAEQIEIAALPLTPEIVFATSFMLMAAMAVVGALIGGALVFVFPEMPVAWAAIVGLVCVAMGWFWPGQDLSHAAENRQTQLTRQLPFAIDLIGSAMRAGLEFGAAMRYYVGLKAGGALEEEFGRVLADVTLGKPFTDALKDMAARVRIESFTSFAGVVCYGAEIGASISQTLKIHGTELRRARFNLAEQKAARAPSVMIFPLALCIMPAVFIVIITPVILRFKATGMGGGH